MKCKNQRQNIHEQIMQCLNMKSRNIREAFTSRGSEYLKVITDVFD